MAILETREVCDKHPELDAALRTLAHFPSLECSRRGPGQQVWISEFSIDPMHAAYTADTLADFGAFQTGFGLGCQ